MQTIKVNTKRRAADEPISHILASLPYRLSDEIKRKCPDLYIEEIRLHLGRRASLVCSDKNILLDTVLDKSEMSAILGDMCQGSLYAYSETINQGYITLPHGVRVGICGRAACEDGKVIGVHEITSISIRIPHKIRDVGETICRLLFELDRVRGVLIYSPPGVGKTTLLRGVAAKLSSGDSPLRTVVIDTRGELSFSNDSSSLCLDVLSGYPRRQGIEIATRSLNAQVIICDEIGDYEEAMELVASHNCGIPLIASAHASTVEQLLSRSGIRLLHEAGIFGAYVGIKRGEKMDFLYDITMRENADTASYL